MRFQTSNPNEPEQLLTLLNRELLNIIMLALVKQWHIVSSYLDVKDIQGLLIVPDTGQSKVEKWGEYKLCSTLTRHRYTHVTIESKQDLVYQMSYACILQYDYLLFTINRKDRSFYSIQVESSDVLSCPCSISFAFTSAGPIAPWPVWSSARFSLKSLLRSSLPIKAITKAN